MSEPRSISQSDAELRSHVVRVLESQYEVEKEIGRGGMGIVYKGRDKRLKRPVAIKLLPPELAFRSEIRQRFLREAEMAAQLSHPHIVPIYSVDEREGLVYFVMALVEGENLGTRIQRQGPIAPDRSKFLPCVTLNLACRTQSRMVPSLHSDSAATCASASRSAMWRPALPTTRTTSPS